MITVHIRNRALVAIVAGLLALSGCGRRGALEPAAGTEAEAKQQAGEALPGVPGPQSGSRRPRPVEPPKEPFILDPIL